MQVYQRQENSAGALSISVQAGEVERTNSAMQYLVALRPEIQISRLVVRLIQDEARREGWSDEREARQN